MTQNNKKAIHLYRLFSYLNERPGLLVGSFYVLLTFVGVIFTSTYYGTFDIPFLQLADLSDFMITGITEPMAMVMLAGGLTMAVAGDYWQNFIYQLHQKWKSRPESLRRTLMLAVTSTRKPSFGNFVFIILIFLLPYTYLFVTRYAGWKGSYVREGHGTYVQLELRSGQAPAQAQILLGSTANYLFVYDVEAAQARIFPVENVAAMQPVLLGEKTATTPVPEQVQVQMEKADSTETGEQTGESPAVEESVSPADAEPVTQ